MLRRQAQGTSSLPPSLPSGDAFGEFVMARSLPGSPRSMQRGPAEALRYTTPRMAKRHSSHTTELTTLAAELNRLNARRETIMRRIQALVATMVAEAPGVAPQARRSARGVRRRRRRRGGRPKGFKVSSATKAKLRAAWKRRKASKRQ